MAGRGKLQDRLRLAYESVPGNAGIILDVGAGNGFFASFLTAKASKVYAIDPFREQIEEGKRLFPKVIFIKGVSEELPFVDSFFDVVTCLDTLEHVVDEKKAVSEMTRVLKPGGVFIVSVPHKGLFAPLDPDNIFFFPLSRLRRRFKKKETDIYELQWHKHYSSTEMKELLAGFEIEKTALRGLFLFPFAFFIAKLIDTAADWTSPAVGKFFRPLHRFCLIVMQFDYNIPYGLLSYNLMIRARKK